MKKYFNYTAVSIVVTLLLSLSVLSPANAAEHLVVMSPRALNDALLLLQERLECAITFEDAPYEAKSRIQELFSEGPRVPKERTIMFEYQPGEQPIEIIKLMLDAYQKVDNSTVYSVQSDLSYENMYHVFPIKYLNQEGVWTAYSSLLDERLTFAIQEGASWDDNLRDFCNQLSKAGTTIDYTGDFRGVSSCPAVFTNTTARDCLVHLAHDISLSQDGAVISWSIRRGPCVPGLDDFSVLFLSRIASTNREQAEYSIIVESQRPLSSAVRMLSNLLKCTVIYEDPEYTCACDVLSNGDGKPQVPSGGRMEFCFDSRTNALEVITASVNAYNEQNGAGKFVANKVGAGIHVYPTIVRDENGEHKPQKALLDEVVSLQGANTTFTDYLDQMTKNISGNRNTLIKCEELPEEILEVPLSSAVGQTAAQVLSDLAVRTGTNLFWQLHYEPRDATFALQGSVQSP